MNTYEISLIVPVHNSYDFVDRIYNNISSQTFKNFEVIIVDDHSQDSTIKAIREKFKNVKFEYKIILSDGNGVSAARNTGIRISQGKYIAFIDDDDTISEKYLDTLYNDAIENRVQVVLSNYEEIYQGQKFKKSLGNYGKFNNRWIREKFLPQTIFSLNGENLIWLPVWRTLIQKDIIIDNNIKFNENISQAEDFIFMLRVLINTKNIFLDSGSPVYFYNRRSNSAMNKYIHNDLKKQLYFHSVFIYILKKYNLYEKVKLRYLSNRLQMYSTVISNAVRSGNYKNAKTDIKNTRNQLLRDKYLNKVKFKYLYNPWFVKLSLLLLKSNNVMFLYLIYLNKENLRLKKLKG
ncbi:glycosyltransferase family A protein [Lactobacillus intestinalis]|uniref:Glycosyltransferase family 2 protein n=2 Tax=Lactobacillus intestinalis TaxID=151781 RepID=A0A4S2BI95_9LACO|nr:glycosyltransferase family A protein [Lactobacillus intestinalis]KAI4309251.1 putative glycosyltransferase EpsJ [Lactobacillus intestinalis]TGY14003.1 glycosyltransferase family 2 protein [Lactobacillus intestinalis]